MKMNCSTVVTIEYRFEQWNAKSLFILDTEGFYEKMVYPAVKTQNECGCLPADQG